MRESSLSSPTDDFRGPPETSGRRAPLVTVIMPVRDGMPFLPATLAAVAAQTHTTLQCIAIDDGSRDDSPAVLAAARGWTLLKTPGTGPNPARQLALQQAEGEFVAFLDQDDIWHRDHVARCVATLRQELQAAAVVAPRQPFQHDRQLRLGSRTGHGRRLDPWGVFPINVIDTPSMVLLRTERLRDEGGWPDDRVLGSDPLLWWLLSVRAPLAISACRSVGVRRTGGSLSARQRQWPLEYAGQMQRAMRDALPRADGTLRASVQSHAEPLMESLLATLEAMTRGEAVVEPARRLERSLAGVPDATAIAALGFLGWLLARDLREDREPQGQDAVRAFLVDWPREAHRTRRMSHRLVAANAPTARIGKLLLEEPTRGSLWRAFLGSCAFRTAGRWGRVDDPLTLPIGTAPRRSDTQEQQ